MTETTSDKQLPVKYVPSQADVLAPDSSEIRELLSMSGGSMVHCTLPPGKQSLAVAHKNIEEIWYCIEGRGQVWRKRGEHESEVDVFPGMCLTIPPQTHFQFRNTDWTPLCFIIVTMPPWPGPQECISVEPHWSSEQA